MIAKSAFIRGPYVDGFEEHFAAATGAKHCVSCANGTDALYIAMRALGLQAGDEVITSAHSWIATAETITQAGGKVVFCDTDQDTFTIDVKRLSDLITPRTVGIIPVHLYGQAADMDPILALAKRHGLWVIEDSAQAHLAKYKGRTVGTFGDGSNVLVLSEQEPRRVRRCGRNCHQRCRAGPPRWRCLRVTARWASTIMKSRASTVGSMDCKRRY